MVNERRAATGQSSEEAQWIQQRPGHREALLQDSVGDSLPAHED